MTPDEKALEAVRSPSFDPWDRYTQSAVDAFLASFTDRDPHTGISVTDPDTAAAAETGMLIMHPTAWEIMQRVDDPATLTDREVLTLVLSSDACDTYSASEWDLMVEQKREAAAARQATERKPKRKRVVRSSHVAPDLAPPSGYSVIPDASLKRPVKERRNTSLKAALERREKRKGLAVVLVPDRKTFDAMSMVEKIELRKRQKEFVLNHDHMHELFADMMQGPDVDYVGFLYNHGRAPRRSNNDLAGTSAWLGNAA